MCRYIHLDLLLSHGRLRLVCYACLFVVRQLSSPWYCVVIE